MMRDGDRWSKAQRVAHLGDLGVPESTATPLFNALFETAEGTAAHVRNVLRHMIRRKTAASSDIKADILFLKHDNSIFRQSSNHVHC